MSYLTRVLALSALAVSPLGMTHAQTVNTQEAATYYADVRGWTVYMMSDGRGINSCRAVRGHGYDDQIMLEYDGFEESWVLKLQAHRPGGGGVGIKGATAYYDGRPVDRQVGFGVPGEDGSSDTHAMMYLEAQELSWLKAGSTLRIDIDDEMPRQFSLSGTTAASLKVEECAANHGFPVAESVAVQPQPQPVPQQAGPVDGFALGYVRFPGGQFRNTGGINWVEEQDNGTVLYFTEYQRTADAVFLNDPSRNAQIWLDLSYYEILYTERFDTNAWRMIYQIDCADSAASRAC